MSAVPTELTMIGEDRLQIVWSDGQHRQYSIASLRAGCPCATCREKKRASDQDPPPLFPVLKPEELQPLRIASLKPMGNYAYHIAFSDGHDTGIYTLERLRELGDEVGA